MSAPSIPVRKPEHVRVVEQLRTALGTDPRSPAVRAYVEQQLNAFDREQAATVGDTR